MNQQRNFSIIEAPSILGFKPSGIELLPTALRAAGFHDRLDARYEGLVVPPPFNPQRDLATQILNLYEIETYSRSLSEFVESVVQSHRFPIVLGGDCSILIGNLLGLRRLGRYGLFFLDGHADFYQPEAAKDVAEVSSMELAIVTGYGQERLANIDNLKPFVREEDVILFAYRDIETARQDGSQDIRNVSNISAHDLTSLRQFGVKQSAERLLDQLLNNPIDGFWIHLDADVLCDDIMPAVDFREPDGLSFAELIEVLQVLLACPKAVGINITIFNPKLDPTGEIAKAFTQCLLAGLQPIEHSDNSAIPA